MIKKEEVYKIGLFNKPHGIHGELQFTFTDDIFDRVDCDYLICLLDGIFVPFFIEEYRFRSDSTALVKLEGIDTAERARMFTNVEVYFPVKHAEEAEDGELSWNFFVGFRRAGRSGRSGYRYGEHPFCGRTGGRRRTPRPCTGRIYSGNQSGKEAHHSRASRRIVEFGRFGGRLIINKDAKKTE